MIRSTMKIGYPPKLWLFSSLPLRKCFKLRFLAIIFLGLILFTYVRLINRTPELHSSDNPKNVDSRTYPNVEARETVEKYNLSDKCNFDQVESLLRYKSLRSSTSDSIDTRAAPSVNRLHKLFSILISYEDKFRSIFDYLGIFRFNDLYNTLHPFVNNTQRLQDIYCLLQRYITISDNGHIDINPQLIEYFKQVSSYLSDGFKSEHSLWKKTSMNDVGKPIIVLSANARFFDTLQASMRTVNQFFSDHIVAIYDLGFDQNQVNLIKDNCPRCIIIPFPFNQFNSIADHVRSLTNFAWKPIIIQDAVRRFGTIIYGDTSVRYMTSNFDRILIDNLIRGFSCRELPGHYVSCFTLSNTFTWFNDTYSIYDDIYIAEAGFVAVTDNFLSRLVLKTWVTCALDVECIAPTNSQTKCGRASAATSIHRFDQSAMVAVLSFFFFQSSRQNDKTDPAPYDMFASIQGKVAEVRRFEGDPGYFTYKTVVDDKANSSVTTTKTP